MAEHQVDPVDDTPLRLGQLVSTASSPSYSALDVRLDPGMVTSPGRFVAVEAQEATSGNQVLVIARVNEVLEVNPHEDAASSTLQNILPFGTQYAPEGSSTVIWRVAETEPLEEAVLNPSGEVVEIRAVETLPRAGADVHDAPPDLTVHALGLVPDPNDGIHVGCLRGNAATPAVLTKEVVQRHVFIGGGIGSGKSYTRGVIGEELHAWGVPQVNIDVNGEMIEACRELGGQNYVPGKEGFTIPLSALSSGDVLEAVPSINAGTNMETLLRFTHESLLREVQMDRRDYFGVDELVANIDQCAKTLEITQRATVEPTKLRTQSLRRLDFIGTPFDWTSALRPGAFINLDCRDMSVGELRLVATSVARDLQNLARAKKIPFVVLSIDEFHLVAPNDDHVVATQVLREIARVGRHYRMGLILTTQSPSDVDRSILKRLLTRFLHAIEPDQLDALKGVFSDASPELVRSLPKLPQGTCILTGAFETVRHATMIQVRSRRTTHGGATPDIFADLKERGWHGKVAGVS